MHARRFSMRRAAVMGAAAALTLVGCNLDVSNPNVIEADTIDPIADARVFSLSAQANFYQLYGALINSTAMYSNEIWTGAARAESNDIGRHIVSDANVDLNGTFWAPIQTIIGTNDQVVDVLKATPTFNSDLNVARSSMWSGFAVELMGEIFCQGVLHVGPALTPAQTLDSAIVRFQRAISIASTLTGAEAVKITNASRVGLARAYLQKGDNANALTTANLVPAAFEAVTAHVEDAQAGNRLRNNVFVTSSATSQSVSGLYRALNDPRVPFVDAGTNTQDGSIRLFRQRKYTTTVAPIRVASGLEARYIAAEAGLKASGATAPALALIAERRTAGGQPAFTGTTTAAILAELMDQRARDFWLEAKHLGDFIRNPAATPYIPQSGAFYKPLGDFAPMKCLEVPFAEKSNNPNF